jgi:hypothetical protein
MGRRVLVVTTVGQAEDELRRQLGDDVDEIRVVVPARPQSVFDRLAHDEQARAEARDAAGPKGGAGAVDDADPTLAVQDALATFEADEIVVVTRPEDAARWLDQGRDAELDTFLGLPVRRLQVPGA